MKFQLRDRNSRSIGMITVTSTEKLEGRDSRWLNEKQL
jgi:hypothetical protein